MNKIKKIFICTTEQSGDNISSEILKKINNKKLIIDGVCGSKSKKYLNEKFFDIKEFKSMGFFEILLSLYKYLNILNYLTNKIIKNKYDLVITIDSPDFNYQLAKKLRKNNYQNKLIHIVAPSVWAWRSGRAKNFAFVYDEIFTLFKFENKYFNKHGLKTTFIGHPIYHIKPSSNKYKKNFIAFLPGSREKEVKKLIYYYDLAYKILLKENFNCVIFIPTVPHLRNLLMKSTKHWKVKTIISTNDQTIQKSYEKVFASLTCSGTASLEMAKRNIPQLIIYKFNFFTTIIASFLVKVKYANLINIFTNKMIIPELTNFNLTKSKFVKQFYLLINDNQRNIEQIASVKKNLILIENKQSPYVISANRIKKLI